MWSFWRKRVRKAQIRGAFGKFISEQGLREIERSLETPSNEFPPLNKEAIHYIILQVRDDTSEDVQRHLAQVLEILIEHDGVVEVFMPSIITATFKPTPDTNKPSLDALVGKLGPDVRAIYGCGEYPRGTYGSQHSFSYGTIFPQIGIKLEALLGLEFGTSKAI